MDKIFVLDVTNLPTKAAAFHTIIGAEEENRKYFI